MAEKMIFLSHIHEERDLAHIFKDALETEFGGFVEIFVSSDGKSIPAGSIFLKKIEEGLVKCVGAIYLASPISVRRSWINFELGAVWVRNAISLKSGGPEIPALPVCHSGMLPSELPVPLNSLNGIVANNAAQLEFSFRSLQSAVGGKGSMRTDFDNLAQKIRDFEFSHIRGKKIADIFTRLNATDDEVRKLIAHLEENPHIEEIELTFSSAPLDAITFIKDLSRNILANVIRIEIKGQ